MSNPHGEQVDPVYSPAATSQEPSSFHESAAQFTTDAANPLPSPAVPAAPVAPAVPEAPSAYGAPPAAQNAYGAPPVAQNAYTAPPAAQNAYGAPPAAAGMDPATQPVYAPGAASVATVAPESAIPAPGGGYTPGYPPAGTSSFPVTGMPVSAYPVVLEPKKKRTGMIVLTVVSIVLGLATAGLGTMYLLEYGKRTQADTKVSEQNTELEAADKKIKEIEAKLSTAKEENAKLNQDLTGAKNKTDEVTKARDALAACFQALNTYAASRSTANARDADAKCNEASKYY